MSRDLAIDNDVAAPPQRHRGHSRVLSVAAGFTMLMTGIFIGVTAMWWGADKVVMQLLERRESVVSKLAARREVPLATAQIMGNAQRVVVEQSPVAPAQRATVTKEAAEKKSAAQKTKAAPNAAGADSDKPEPEKKATRQRSRRLRARAKRRRTERSAANAKVPARTLSRDEIVQSARRQGRTLRSCLTPVGTSFSGGAENVALNWTIEPSGRISGAHASGGTVASGSSVSACIQRRMEKWRFPRPVEAINITNFPLAAVLGGD